MISIKVPARICFFGDHQDYLGLPVVAGTIDRFITLRAKPIAAPAFQLNLLDIDQTVLIPLLEPPKTIAPKDYLRAAMRILDERGFTFKTGYQIDIFGDIPVNAGLSSSSALMVAWIRFLITIQEKEIQMSDAEIGQLAYEAEVGFFNGPGGLMDQYTIAQQGLLCIDTEKGKAERLQGNFGQLVIAESGISKMTLEVLKNARAFQEKAVEEVKEKTPSFSIRKAKSIDYKKYRDMVSAPYRDYWFAAVYNYDITQRALRYLRSEKTNVLELGKLMDEHQKILENNIRNTPKAMIEMMNAARKAGAIGSKIIGSGGGGCMVAMASEKNIKGVINAFLQSGAKDAYEVKLTYPSL